MEGRGAFCAGVRECKRGSLQNRRIVNWNEKLDWKWRLIKGYNSDDRSDYLTDSGLC